MKSIANRKKVFQQLLLVQSQEASSVFGQAKTEADGVIPQVVEYLKEQWDPKHKVASISAILLPAILDALSLGIFGWILTFAEALGWINIREIFINIGEKLEPLFQKAANGEQVDTSQVSNIVSSQLSSSAGEASQSLTEKAIKLLPGGISSLISQNNSTEFNRVIRKIAIYEQVNVNKIVEAGIFSGILGKLGFKEISKILQDGVLKNLGKLFFWIFQKIFKSLTMLAVPAAGVSFFGKTPGEEGGSSNYSSSDAPTTNESQKIQLKLNSSLPSEYTQYNPNNYNSVWMEQFPIEDIKNKLVEWVTTSYPDLKDKVSQIEQLPSFNKMVDYFVHRNNSPSPLKLTVVPQPYNRIIDIVNTIVRDFENRQGK